MRIAAPHLIRVMLTLVIALLVVACGYYTLFSSFMPWDDEGLFLRASQRVLAGEPLYTAMSWPFGPAYGATTELVHALLGIPLNTHWLRLLALGSWLGIALLCGLLVWRWGGGTECSLVAAVLAFLFCTAIAKEPGHPQGMISLLVLMMPLLLSFPLALAARWPWFLVGLLLAWVLQTKLNAGAFALLALSLVLVPCLPFSRDAGWFQRWLPLLVLPLPLLLMAPLLNSEQSWEQALICGFTLAAMTLTLVRQAQLPLLANGQLAALAAGLVLTISALFLHGWLRGAPPLDILGGLLQHAESQADFYHFFRDYSVYQLGGAMLSPLVALLVARQDHPDASSWLLPVRLYFLSAVAYAVLLDDPQRAHSMLGWAAPWAWVVLYPGERSLSLALLAAIAATFPMLVYPIPGSQLYFATVFLIPLAAIALARQLRERLPPATVVPVGQVAVLLLAIVLAWKAVVLQSEYATLQPLDLPGTGSLRLSESRVRQMRSLVEEYNRSDVALANSGFNSLYSWSEASPPAPLLFGLSLRFLSEQQQASVREGLEQAGKPVVIMNRRRYGGAEVSPLEIWIEDNYRETRRIGPYSVLRRKAQTE